MRGSILLALALAGCGSDPAGGGGSAGAGAGGSGGMVLADGAIGCLNDSRALTYTANMMQPGHSGTLKFVLQASDPAPPIRGNNNWTIKVTDAMGAPVMGLADPVGGVAPITVKPFMPDHGHGTSVVPTVTAMGDGYLISNVYLFMAGLWQVTITVAGAQSDFAVFSFCIAG